MLEELLIFLETLYKNIKILQKIIQYIRKLWKVGIYFIILLIIFLFLLQIKVLRNFILKYSAQNQIITYIYNNSNYIIFIFFIILSIVYLYKIWKIGKIDNQKNTIAEEFVDKLHTNFIHDIRDNIKELDNNIEDFNKNIEVLSNRVRTYMFENLTRTMQAYTDFLADYLSGYCDSTISVCIKIVKFEDQNEDKPEAMTLTRSSNTKKNRVKENEIVSIKDNDDFKFLYEGKNTFYGKANLIKEHNEGNYNVQDNINIWSRKYMSTLIAPIRYYSENIKYNNTNLNFDILGFLCIDSDKVMKQWENPNSHELNVLAIFADTMYIYLKKYKEIYLRNN